MNFESIDATKFTVTTHNAEAIVRQKILSSMMSKTLLQTQIEYSNDVIRLQALAVQTAKKKIELIDQLNKVLEEQLKDFTEERQKQFEQLNADINDCDRPTQVQNKIVARLDENKEKMLNLVNKIAMLEAEIPATFHVINEKARFETEFPTAAETLNSEF